ncbi:hypothetical protein OED52_11725 [Rhodococcus sp. Z13]|uniref:Uncharacterized protein n=1 Tax=Rhodococcus sacchari TaxID=2962047 RepID=A0ACD4DBH1_9NOCA|nr:hypothetical protein [Rhodococcus sp. Z13]UYP17376.1 hypothetical protein OED52_11725 [Rhodococcus sp. Z13]
MTASRHEMFDFTPRSQRRALAILVLGGMLAIGFLGAVFTNSYLMGGIFALLTGACIVLAHLMIAPADIFDDEPSEHVATQGFLDRLRHLVDR